MPRTIDGADAFMRDPANKNRHQGDGWHNLCEQFTNNAGDFGQSFGTALAAGNASGWLDPNLATITDGSIGYWGGVWIWSNELGRMEECGHTAFWRRGRWLMASDAVTEMVGNGTGTITAPDYARKRSAAIWRGHSKRHGTETLAASSFAGLTETAMPTPPTLPKDDDVTIYLKPTSDSSPLSDGISRIWTGYRTIAGIDYADVWGVDGNGDARRLTAVQWRILNALPKEAITLNVVELTGNELEQIVYAPSF